MLTQFLLNSIEVVRQFFFLLDPRTHFKYFRVLRKIWGDSIKPSRKFAILVTYAGPDLPAFLSTFIAAYHKANYNVVVVANGRFDALAKRKILSRCSLLIERTNVGRDFGGYKDAIGYVIEHFGQIDRLVIANDSVYFLNKGLDDLVQRMEEEGNFVGVAEVHQHTYHVASFWISFGAEVVASAAFRNFWKRYLPISTRMWSIMAGEIGLTKTLTSAGFRHRILYQTDDLYGQLQSLDLPELRRAIELMPINLSRRFDIAGNAKDLPARAPDIATSMIAAIKEMHPLHAAGLLFVRFCGLPLLKRDLAYRELFPVSEIAAFVRMVDDSLSSDIIADLASRRPPSRTDFIRRFLYSRGYI